MGLRPLMCFMVAWYIYSGFRIIEFSGQLKLLQETPRWTYVHELVIWCSAATQSSRAKENILWYKLLNVTGSIERILSTRPVTVDKLDLGGRNRTDSEITRDRMSESEIMIETLNWHELVQLPNMRTLCVLGPYTSPAFWNILSFKYCTLCLP